MTRPRAIKVTIYMRDIPSAVPKLVPRPRWRRTRSWICGWRKAWGLCAALRYQPRLYLVPELIGVTITGCTRAGEVGAQEEDVRSVCPE